MPVSPPKAPPAQSRLIDIECAEGVDLDSGIDAGVIVAICTIGIGGRSLRSCYQSVKPLDDASSGHYC